MERRPPLEEWQEATRNRRGANRRSEKNGRHGRQITKFFMANLPEDCGRKEISEAMEGYGEIENVYIAKKRNALGQVFGFVSFVDVYDGLALQRKLSRISIGGNRIKVNIAKFAVENYDQSFAHLKRGKVEAKSQSRVWENQTEARMDPRGAGEGTYLEKLLNVKSNRKIPDRGFEGSIIKISDEFAAFKELYGKAVIGKVSDFDVLRNAKSLLQEDGWDSFDVVYLGGLVLLIVFDKEERALAFSNENRRLLFEDREVWRGQTFPFEKLVWLNVVGVPLHLAGKEVYDLIGGKFGKVVHHVNPQVEDGDISAGCIGVLRGDGVKIEEEIKLAWKDLTFSVWIKEVGGTWMPEGVGKAVRKEPDAEDMSESDSDSSKLFSVCSPRGDFQEKEIEKGGGEPSCMHGEDTSKDSPKGNINEGLNVTFKGVDFGVVFPKKKKEKRKLILKKAPVAAGQENLDSLRRSVSPRPRKRCRADDPFGLDDVIKDGLFFICSRPVNDAGEPEGGTVSGLGIDGDGVRVANRLDEAVTSDRCLEGAVFREEIRGTVEIGKSVGMDLEGFEKEVGEAISGEGIDLLNR